MAGFGNFPGFTSDEKKRNQIYFDSESAYIFYISYNENLINRFYSTRQLLPDLLDI